MPPLFTRHMLPARSTQTPLTPHHTCPLHPRTPSSSPPLPSTVAGVRPSSPSGKPSGLKTFVRSLVDPVPGDAVASLEVGVLCLAQFLQSLSGITVMTLLPLYLTGELGLSLGRIGQLESLSMLLQKLSNFGSGVAGDLWSHKRLLVFGSVLFALGRPMFAMTGPVYAAYGAAGVLWWVSAARLIDKVTKGIRDTPMKAMIADIAGANRDAALGSKAAYQNLANVLGGVAVSWLFAASGQSYVLCFTLAVVPAVAAAVLCAFVPDAEDHSAPAKASKGASATGEDAGAVAVPAPASPWSRVSSWVARLRLLPAPFWQWVAVCSVLMLARFEGSFVNIRVAAAGVSRIAIPTMVSANMAVQFFTSKAASSWVSAGDTGLADSVDRARESIRRRNISCGLGFAALLAANAAFGLGHGAGWMWAGYVLVGLHMGLTHYLLSSTLQAYTPSEIRGTAMR